MAPRRMRKGKKRAGKRRGMRKRPISKGLGGVPEMASLTEIVSNRTTGRAFYATNVGYRLYDIALNQFIRASTVAQGYQEYRIRRISIVFKTTADTFSSVGSSVPFLSFVVDKKNTVPSNFTIDTLAQMGARPTRFDDKNKVWRYAPAVLQSALTDASVLGTTVSSSQIHPWLPTNSDPGQIVFAPSTVDHLGASWMVYAPSLPSPIYYDIDFFVDFEFRKPRFNSPNPMAPQAVNWNQLADIPSPVT